MGRHQKAPPHARTHVSWTRYTRWRTLDRGSTSSPPMKRPVTADRLTGLAFDVEPPTSSVTVFSGARLAYAVVTKRPVRALLLTERAFDMIEIPIPGTQTLCYPHRSPTRTQHCGDPARSAGLMAGRYRAPPSAILIVLNDTRTHDLVDVIARDHNMLWSRAQNPHSFLSEIVEIAPISHRGPYGLPMCATSHHCRRVAPKISLHNLSGLRGGQPHHQLAPVRCAAQHRTPSRSRRPLEHG